MKLQFIDSHDSDWYGIIDSNTLTTITITVVVMIMFPFVMVRRGGVGEGILDVKAEMGQASIALG